MKLEEAQKEFIKSWGMLGSSWGINKAMAQIHALLLIAPEPLSTEEIMNELQISRGNANMNIRALIDWGIAEKEQKLGDRKDYFKTDKDIMVLAGKVTRERRRREIEPLLNMLKSVQEVEKSSDPESKEFKKVTKEILEFSKKVDGMLDKFSKTDQNWFYKLLLKM